MKPKIPNQRNEYKKLNERLNRYVLMVEDIYSSTVEEVAKMAAMVGYDGTGEFHFADYPQLKAKVDEVFTQWVGDMEAVVYRGTSEEWKNSNLCQDLLVNRVLKAYDAQVSGEKYKVYYDPNSDALKTFQKRRDRGMNLSDKLWKQEKSLRYELEEAISTAITKGTSAVTLSKRISKYLKDYPSLERDYKAKFGKATRSSDCEYRSIRLARSEINMAYRSSENERWRKLDFVVGYEIKVSHKHKVADICDDLAGKYPKDFEWVGWHPNCTDYKIPILKTEDEFFSVDDKPSVNEVKDVPDSFKNWVRDNQASIKRAEARGTAPYFVRDNRKLVDGIIVRDNLIKIEPSLLPEDRRIVRQYLYHNGAMPAGGMKSLITNLEHSTDSYLESMASQSPVIKAMVDELRSDKVKNGDQMYRKDLINKIKQKCSVLTRWNLRRAGAVDGLDYVGMEMNKVFSPEYINLGVKSLMKDVVCFADSYGIKYYYPLGANSGNIPYKAKDAHMIFKEYYTDAMRRKFKGVLFDIDFHPLDEYYRKAYTDFKHGAMYATDIVSAHGKFTKFNEFRDSFTHEIGHHVDKNHMYSSSRAWKDAIRLDGDYVSKYARNNDAEDFAETFKIAYKFVYAGEEYDFEKMYPNRWKILEKIFATLM